MPLTLSCFTFLATSYFHLLIEKMISLDTILFYSNLICSEAFFKKRNIKMHGMAAVTRTVKVAASCYYTVLDDIL